MQDQEMSEDHFQMLASSYGANLRQWPRDERAAAGRLVLVSKTARAILDQQRKLDAQLSSYVIAEPTAALLGRILASAPSSRPAGRQGRLWWSIGLLGAALAGCASGAAAVTLSLSLSVSAVDEQTIFGEITLTEFIDE